MTSFQRLWEHMNSYRETEEHRSETKAMDAIRTGLNIRPDFWDDFLLVINNSEGLSALLEIPSIKISSWHSKVQNVLQKVQQHDTVPDPKKKGKLMHTAEEDPFGGGSTPEPPEDSDQI